MKRQKRPTYQQVLNKLRQHITDNYKSDKDFAKKHKVQPSNLSDILAGDKQRYPNKSMQDEIGAECEIIKQRKWRWKDGAGTDRKK